VLINVSTWDVQRLFVTTPTQVGVGLAPHCCFLAADMVVATAKGIVEIHAISRDRR
jgi:hypothetical protein